MINIYDTNNIGMPQSGSEPKFEPELFRTGPKFGPRFNDFAEPDHKSGSAFGKGAEFKNCVEPSSNRTFCEPLSPAKKFWFVWQSCVYD